MGNVRRFALYFKRPKKNREKVVATLLQFVVRSPSKGADSMLTSVDKECSGNDRMREKVCPWERRWNFVLVAEQAARGC